jgi:hypothetical protein
VTLGRLPPLHTQGDESMKLLKEGHHFMVYNLCIESDRQYDVHHFDGCVEAFPFYDHNCPPLWMIPKFCQHAHAWLEADPVRN